MAAAYQLEIGQIAFPPEVLLKPRAERGDTVVGVHENVHEGVDHRPEERWIQSTKKLSEKSVNLVACKRQATQTISVSN